MGIRLMVKRIGYRSLFIVMMAIAIVIAVGGVSGAEVKKLAAPRIEDMGEGAPKIDGALDDPCWQKASKGDGFIVGVTNKLAEEQTEIFVCFDNTNLYFGFYCHDSQPDKIVASQKERDASFSNDDYICVSLDTHHEHGLKEAFYVNAIGTQRDRRTLGTAGKIEWKGDWSAAAARVADGWTGEMAIPFSILSYKSGATSMGLNVGRNVKRLDEYSTWVHTESDDPAEMNGDLEGLVLPKIKRKPLLMPYFLSNFTEDNIKGKVGFDMKHQIGEDTTLFFTAFPDFGYVESAVKRIDFSYTSQYYSDNRPFFQEASMIFDTQYIYTSLIPDFDYGMKIFGKKDKLDYGIMSCLGKHNRLDSEFASHYKISNETHVYFTMVGRDDDEINNKVLTFSMDKDLFSNTSCWLSGSKSVTSGAEKDGIEYDVGVSYYNEPWSFYGSFSRDSKFFYPATSYFSYSGTSSWYISGTYDKDRPGKSLRSYYIYCSLGRTYDGDHGLISSNKSIYSSIDFANNTSWSLSHNWGPYIANYYDEPGTEYYWNTDSSTSVDFSFNNDDSYRSGSISYDWGRTAGGPDQSFSFKCGFLPMKKLSNSITFQKVHRSNPEEGTVDKWLGILGIKYEITPEKSISARLLRQDEGMNFTMSYRQQVRKGLDIYALFGDYSAAHTKMKLSVKMVMTL